MVEQSYHFIAIGGVGMSGIAKFLVKKGYSVSGSDVCDSKYIKLLKDLGVKTYIGHSPDNIKGSPIVVVSSAIKDDNPELKFAREKGLTIFHRSDILAQIANNENNFIGFSGTHGKTTTSGLLAYVLSKAGYNPSYIVGGIIPELYTNSDFSNESKFFSAELDESDGTITKYRPNTLVINNLEADHLDFYKNGLQSIIETFEKLISNLDLTSKVIVNIDNSGVQQLKNVSNFITYGLNYADYTAKNIVFSIGKSTFDVYYKNEFLSDIEIILPGEHNIYNTLAVISVLHQNNININDVKEHFKTFSGMGRRFQIMGTIKGAAIYDDYAHHPTEILSTLNALKSFTDKKIIAVFQPHRYSRLKNLWNDFINALKDTDKVVVTDVFAASEQSIDGINSENFAKNLKNSVYITGSINNVAKNLLEIIDDKSVVIGLGAGDITNLYKELKREYERN